MVLLVDAAIGSKCTLVGFRVRLGQGHGHRAWTVLNLVREVVGLDEKLVALTSVTMYGKDLDDSPEEFVRNGSKGWWFHSGTPSIEV